jgi:hypothetical protein
MEFAIRYRSVVTLMMIAFLAGCGGGSGVDLTDISGKATFDGAPIVYGQVEFFPKDPKSPPGFADIIDGEFDTSVEGSRGIVPGPHEIRVSAYPEKPPENADEDETVSSDNANKPLFLGYKLDADIQESTFDLIVPADAKGFGISSGGGRRNEP